MVALRRVHVDDSFRLQNGQSTIHMTWGSRTTDRLVEAPMFLDRRQAQENAKPLRECILEKGTGITQRAVSGPNLMGTPRGSAHNGDSFVDSTELQMK